MIGRHHQVNARGVTIDVYDYVHSAGTAARLQSVQHVLERMPDPHLSVVYPILLVEHKPNRGRGGGSWRATEVRGFVGHVRDTGVPDEDVEALLARRTGVIGIPRDRWEREPGYMIATVMHEVAHSVDYELGLRPDGARPTDFAGVRPTCGAGHPLVRHVVECYARYIVNPATICRDAVPGQTQAEASRVVAALLRRAPAFHGVSPSWRPGH